MVNIEDEIVRRYLKKIVGEDGVIVIEAMPEEATDIDLAEKSGYSLNMIRKILFILHEKNIAHYRKKREKESGWLTYYWKVDLKNVETNLKSELRHLYKNLKERLDFEKENVFYVCSSDIPCGRYTFDYASDNYFICPVCGAEMESEDNTEIVEKLEKRVGELEKVIKTL
ncbi:MAG: Transcription factor E [Candidatus Methanolliviera sp. GoM_asphalt]|nr:MAG: Transcription factor E [Candidatus Methanolliviera sp. GoM_asphalt]